MKTLLVKAEILYRETERRGPYSRFVTRNEAGEIVNATEWTDKWHCCVGCDYCVHCGKKMGEPND